MKSIKKYFTTKQDDTNRYLFFSAQGLFTLGSFVNYYYTEREKISMRELILSFVEFLGALCMCLFQYRAKWLRGTIVMCIALFVSAFVFFDFLLLYIKKETTLVD